MTELSLRRRIIVEMAGDGGQPGSRQNDDTREPYGVVSLGPDGVRPQTAAPEAAAMLLSPLCVSAGCGSLRHVDRMRCWPLRLAAGAGDGLPALVGLGEAFDPAGLRVDREVEVACWADG